MQFLAPCGIYLPILPKKKWSFILMNPAVIVVADVDVWLDRPKGKPPRY